MAIVHEIQLDGYCARFSGVGARLCLGTYGSYGIEQLHIELGERWQGLVVYANFVTADGTTPVLVPKSGLVDVPPEATANPGTGDIVLDGTADGVHIYSVNIPYTMLNHSDLSGEAPAPTPDRWQQFVAQVKADADRAEQAAGAASDSAAAAAKSAEAAAESAKQAEQAGADIGAAKDDALEAIQQAQDTGVQAVEGATTTGVQAVQQAHKDAIDDIATDRQQALADIEDVGDKQQSAITSSGAEALEAIGQTEQAAIGQVEQAGTAQVTAVETAGQAQLDKINAANALVPTPTQADAGKAIIVKPDGSGYEFGEVQTDAYTKAESDARYAPIAAAIRPTVNGNPATLEHSVAWAMQGLNVHGKSTQVTTTGRNLLPWTPFEPVTRNGVTFECVSDGIIKVVGTATANVDSPIMDMTKLSLAPGTYCMIGTGIDNLSLQFVVKKAATGQNFWYGSSSIVIEEGDQPQYFYVVNRAVGVPLDILVYAYLQTGVGPVTSADFEPYSGAVPSPSPAYPQPINTAGSSGSITVTVSDGADQSQQLSIQTPNGLPGIPVDSGGNYTDAGGQAWVSDVVDQSAVTKNVVVVVLDGTESVSVGTASGAKYPYLVVTGPQIVNACAPFETPWTWYKAAVSNYFSAGNPYSEPGDLVAVLNQNDVDQIRIGFSDLETFSTAQGVKNWLAEKYQSGNPVIVMYPSKVSTVTPLTDEELAAYAALRTYDGTTVVATDAPVAGLSARYVADGAAYIESKIQAALSPVYQAVLEAKTNV